MNAEKIEIELTDNEFIDILNDLYEDVNICGYRMYQGDVLYKCDEIAFNEMKNNYEDSLSRDNEQWKCSICDEIYDNKDEADECCKGEPDELIENLTGKDE